MDNAEIKQLSTTELEERVKDEKNALLRLKMNHAVSPIENPQKIKYTRKTIAKLNTELSARKLAEEQK